MQRCQQLRVSSCIGSCYNIISVISARSGLWILILEAATQILVSTVSVRGCSRTEADNLITPPMQIRDKRSSAILKPQNDKKLLLILKFQKTYKFICNLMFILQYHNIIYFMYTRYSLFVFQRVALPYSKRQHT